MRSKLKGHFANLLSSSGILALTRRLSGGHKDLVVTFHRVLPLLESKQCYDEHLLLSTVAFESLLIYLKQHCEIVDLNTLLTSKVTSSHVQRIALTFDDGWQDTFKYAYPILLRHNVPATVFICTSLIGSAAMLPEERLTRIFDHCVANACTPSFLQHLGVWGGAERLAASRDWRSFTDTIPMTAKLSLTAHLEGVYGLERQHEEHLMTWQEVHTMASTGIEIGSHTANHVTLNVENRRVIERELKDSRDVITLKLGIAPRYLSYPNGAHNQAVVLLAREAGYSHAFTMRSAGVGATRTSFTVPRIVVDDSLIADTQGDLHPAKIGLLLSPLRKLFSDAE